MKGSVSFLCLLLVACTQTELDLGGEQQGITLGGTTGTTPIVVGTGTGLISTTPAFPVTEWSPTVSIDWPDGATRVQVILRTGDVDAAGTITTFYAFVVADGVRMHRIYRGRAGDHLRFRGAIDLAFDAKETPSSGRSHGTNGSVYSGPRIGGGPPGGDPLREIPGWYVDRVVRSGASIEDSTLLSTERTL